MRFSKYHALGNDYLVIRSSDTDGNIQGATIERICHRNYCVGSDGFLSTEIPVIGSPREVLREQITVLDRTFLYCAATVGNPHCVVLCEQPTAEIVRRYGPLVEKHSHFPKRTNVQFMKILDRATIQIEIWERGAGYTLASGSSSTASAAVAHKLGLCDSAVAVHMPGGILNITLSEKLAATMRGPVVRVCSGIIDSEVFEERGHSNKSRHRIAQNSGSR